MLGFGCFITVGFFSNMAILVTLTKTRWWVWSWQI